ncbi:MAG: hypothetical protein ABI947_05075 [Chloroflexota bacterium]
MQQTRQLILEVLHEQGEATVELLVKALAARTNHDITAVTVRHHLDVLRSEDLITAPIIRRRSTPGRPQHVFALTEKAMEHFPNNYQNLAENLLNQIKATLTPPQVNVIIEQIADSMVANAGLHNLSFDVRMDHVVEYLNKQGYDAQWEACPEGYILRTRNCPYRNLASDHEELCGLDSRLITGLTGVIPRRLGRIVEHDESCAYLIPIKRAMVNE